MKVSKILKRSFLIIISLLVLIIGAAIAIPYFFKDEILARVKEDINKNFQAKIDFGDVDLSLFRSFPDFNFQMEDFSITGIDEFEGMKLVSSENLDFTLDLKSVFNSESPIEIKSFNIDKPDIHIKVLRNGKANYDIVPPAEATTDTTTYNFLIKLQEYSITDGKFVYDDRLGDIFVEINDLDHTGSGQFTADVYDIFTETTIESLTAKSGGIAYLRKAKAKLDATLNADMKTMKFTLKENELTVNALKVNADGFVQLVGDDIKMDITYNAPKNKFKNFLSLIPSAYTADFQDVKANGDLQLDGFVKGTYTASGQLPAFQVNLKIDNGDFRYPDLPLGIDNINTTAKINSPSSDFDKMTIDVPRFSMKLGNNPFQANFKLRTPISDPDIDTDINGMIDLDELSKAFPMEGVKALNGLITANLSVNTKLSFIEKEDYENVDMSGDLRIENLNYNATDMPEIQIEDLQMNFNPRNVKLANFAAKLGKSDIQARGTIDNILAYFSPEKTMEGDFVVRSNYFDANEWLPEETATAEPVAAVEGAPAEEELFDRFDFKLDGQVDKLLYDVYQLDNTRLKGNVTPNEANIVDFYTKIEKSDFSATGKVTNIFNYLFENEVLYGNINLTSKFIDLNQFMLEEEATGEPQAKTIADPVLEPIKVPENIDFNINADLGKVLYTNIDLNSIKGKLAVKDETVEIKDCDAKAFGGSFTMNGSYNSQDEKNPAFSLQYDVKKFQFSDAFEKLNTFATLAPIGKFIDGIFNTRLEMNGKVGQDMMPILGSLTADGYIETLNGVLKNFGPLQEFANKLNLDKLKSLKIQNTRNWFEVKNGFVELKPFDYEYEGIDMNIGGSHSLENEMDYNIKAKIPRKLLESNSVGAATDKGLKFLEKEASKIGLNLNSGEFVNVLFNIKGSLTSPKFDFKLLGASGEPLNAKDIAKDLVNKAKDTLSTLANEKITELKDTVAKVVEDKTAELRAKADKEIKKLMQEAEKQAKNIQDTAKKLADETEKLGYANADKLVKDAGDNFLKKKAAEVGAKELRKKTDQKVADILAEGDKNAQKVMDAANKKADDILKKYGLE